MLWQIPLALALFAARFIYNYLSKQQEEPRRPIYLPLKQESPITPTPSPLQIPERRISMRDVSFLGKVDSPVYAFYFVICESKQSHSFFFKGTFVRRESEKHISSERVSLHDLGRLRQRRKSLRHIHQTCLNRIFMYF
jgi:hypothetical protein